MDERRWQQFHDLLDMVFARNLKEEAQLSAKHLKNERILVVLFIDVSMIALFFGSLLLMVSTISCTTVVHARIAALPTNHSKYAMPIAWPLAKVAIPPKFAPFLNAGVVWRCSGLHKRQNIIFTAGQLDLLIDSSS